MMLRLITGGLLAAALAACTPSASTPDGGGGNAPDASLPGVDSGTQSVDEDVLTTDLVLDLSQLTGVATVRVQPAEGSGEVVLDVSGLQLKACAVDGVPLVPTVTSGLAHFPVSRTDAPVEVVVHYGFPARGDTYDGWMPGRGEAFTWPFFCGNLFPCHPTPADGVTFTLEVTGVPAGKTAVYPRTTYSDGPAYMPAIAVGTYEELSFGKTDAGTTVRAWIDTSIVTEQEARAGMGHLVAMQDFYEQRIGPYSFGPEVGAVSVDWGKDSWGGIEFHPYYHVPKYDFATEEVHAHEAAHAWFGNGVRFACWEDFVLSEGTVTYLAARALEKSGAPDAWPMYVDELTGICDGDYGNAVALKDATCNAAQDFMNEWSLVQYMKGACFYEGVADLLGWDTVDGVISDFYRAHVGKAARMADMLAALKAKAPAHAAQVEALENEWLRTLACPADYAVRCGTHSAR